MGGEYCRPEVLDALGIWLDNTTGTNRYCGDHLPGISYDWLITNSSLASKVNVTMLEQVGAKLRR